MLHFCPMIINQWLKSIKPDGVNRREAAGRP
jgi:hypothetical protein